MAGRATWRKVGRFSGYVVSGVEKAEPPDSDLHVDRAFWLTAEVETGNRMGGIMAADGTAATAGMDQHILVYPKELAHEDYNAEDDQGGLGKLLRRIEVEVGGDAYQALHDAFKSRGWYLGQDGQLRWLEKGDAKVKNRTVRHRGGDVVHGATIRDELTPMGGKVPDPKLKRGAADAVYTDRWKEARWWALLFHEVFADPRTYAIQRRYGVEHLIERTGQRRLQVNPRRRRTTVLAAVYGNADLTRVRQTGLGEWHLLGDELDLAMCVYHSHSVNAPYYANKALAAALVKTGYVGGSVAGQEELALELLKKIKATRYGRWDKRWARTRKAAMAVGWWDRSLFIGPDAVMPK